MKVINPLAAALGLLLAVNPPANRSASARVSFGLISYVAGRGISPTIRTRGP